MLDSNTMRRITGYVVGASALLVLAALALGGMHMAIGALAGGLFSVLNWSAMRWVGTRILVANDKGRLIWGSLLVLKMSLSLLVVWLILSTGAFDPIGFVIGLSGLVLGILAGTFHTALTAPAPSAEEA